MKTPVKIEKTAIAPRLPNQRPLTSTRAAAMNEPGIPSTAYVIVKAGSLSAVHSNLLEWCNR